MKKVKWTPILILFLPLIIVHTLLMIYVIPWTTFSIYLIIGFISLLCVALAVDRAVIGLYNIHTIRKVEGVILIFSFLIFMTKCI